MARDMMRLRRGILLNTPHIETSSGAVASFKTDVSKLKGLSVSIEPVQDLNGYDAPWPPGGGKNKLKNKGTSGNRNGIVWTMNADGSITLSGTASANTFIYFNTTNDKQQIANGSCTLVCSAQASYNPTIIGLNFQNDIYVDGTYGGTIQKDNAKKAFSGDVIEVGTSRLYVREDAVIPSGTTFYPAIEIGDAISATWTPYSNICPISGWSEAKIWVQPTHDTTANPTVTIDLDGARYGGTLDLLTGVLTVTHAIYQPLSTYTPDGITELGSYARCTYSSNSNKPPYPAYYPDGSFSSDTGKYSHGTYTNAWSGQTSHGYVTASQVGYFWFPCSATAAAIQAFLAEQEQAGTPVTVCYEIASPFTVQLTAQQLQTLVGTNNIWADTGNIEVKYWTH